MDLASTQNHNTGRNLELFLVASVLCFYLTLLFFSSRLNLPLIRLKVSKMCFSSVHSKYHHWEVLARAGVNTGVVLDLPWEGSRLPCINSWLYSCSVPPPNPLLSWSIEKGESHAPCRLGTYFIKENISSTTSEAKTKKEENRTP